MTEAFALRSNRSAAIGSRLLGTVLSIVSLLVPCIASAEIPVPPLKARVTDLTATLSSNEQTQLESRLRDFEQRKGSQIAVLIVPTTKPETIEQYSIRVVEKWKLGRKRVDDGVLILIAMQDRKLRIEVGRGLEGAIPDAVAKRIIDLEISPRFRQGQFHAGIVAAVDQIIGRIDPERLPDPTSSRPPSSQQSPAKPFLPPDTIPRPSDESTSAIVMRLLDTSFHQELWVVGLILLGASAFAVSYMGPIWGWVWLGAGGVLLTQVNYRIVYGTWSFAVLYATLTAIVWFALFAGVILLIGWVFELIGRGLDVATGGRWSSWTSGGSGSDGFAGGGGDFGGGGASGGW